MSTKHRMRTAIAVAAISTVVVAGGTTALAGGPKDPARSATAAGATPTAAKAEKGSFARVSPATRVRTSGNSVKKQLRRLAQAHNRLVQAHNQLVTGYNQLARAFYNCEATVPVTQYPGYDYQGNIGATTALDFTEPGGFVDEHVVVWIC